MNVDLDNLINQSFPSNNQRPVRLAVKAPKSSTDVYIERSSPLQRRSIE
jgi:hypothetical protein